MNVGKDDVKTDFTIHLVYEYFSDLDLRLVLVLSKEDNLYDASLLLKYTLDDDHDDREPRIKAQLTNLHASTESLTLQWDSDDDELVEDYLDAVLNAPPARLKKLSIVEGNLESFDRVENSPPRALIINQLIFKGTSLEESVLPFLSQDFPTLDYLEFDDCNFDIPYPRKIDISMPNTAIITLKLNVGDTQRRKAVFDQLKLAVNQKRLQ